MIGNRTRAVSVCALALLHLAFAPARPGLAQTPAPAPPAGRYPFKSAIITYEMTGAKSGTKTVTIKGTKQAIEEKGVQLGNEFHVLYLMDGDDFTVVNLATQEGTKMHLTPEMRKQIEQGGMPSMSLLGQNLSEQMKKEVGKEKVLDRECSVREVLGQRICVWGDSVPLKSEGNVMGIQLREVATKIEEDVDIPDSRFEVPQGTKLKEMAVAAPATPSPSPSPAAAAAPAEPTKGASEKKPASPAPGATKPPAKKKR